ncbi:MAG: ATP-binding protein [Thermoplasmata archaeon]
MEKSDLIEELRLQNPWWTGGEPPIPEDVVERDILHDFLSEIRKKTITGLIGLRRTGKTTLLRMLIKDLLKENDGKRICYFSFDLGQDVDIRTLVKVYSEEIIKEPYGTYHDRIYFFFDEIQKLDRWGDLLKSIQDRDMNIKFFVTGSSSMNITKGAGESLVGRIKIRRLNPFSFREYLRYVGEKTTDVNLLDLHYPKDAPTYRIRFNEYMERGGFPELYDSWSKEDLKEILDLIFFRDIVDMFTVKRTDVLKGLFIRIAERSGQRINYANLANDLNTQYRTIKDYLQYLEDSFLVSKSMPVEEDHIKASRKNPKMYASDHSFTCLWGTEKGHVAETVAFNHLNTFEHPCFNSEPEVDLVLPDRKIALEIKYRTKVDKKDAVNLLGMPKDYRTILVTEETYDRWIIDDREIEVIPLWLLTLCDLS